MYTEYVEILAKHANGIFEEMTGADVLNHRIKLDERLGVSTPYAYTIAYEHMEKNIKGQFVLGFANNAMAVAVASALAEKMGLPPVSDLDDIAVDLLGEFLNTIIGRTISEWDQMGLPVRFSPPQAERFARIETEEGFSTESYVIILSLAFSHIIFRLTFQEERALEKEPRRILVVEDSAVIRNVIAKTLEQFGFKVRQAENGQRAVEIYESFQPDLVLMDLVMPELGGLPAMSTIRSLDPEARFIVLTSSSRRDEVLAAKDIGVAAYLIKPFNPDLLMREINKVFDNKDNPQ